jgi:hypothetical protein
MANTFTIRESGLAVPAEPPTPPKRDPFEPNPRDIIRQFECYHESDVFAFMRLLEKSGGSLCAVNLIGSGPFHSMSSWYIFYRHTEELSMEVRC